MEVDQIITSFKQGKRGNCVSIAVIKTAIRHYGIDNVFSNVKKRGNKYKIEMRDGFDTVIREHEIQKGARFSKFNKGSDETIREKAYFYFTAMAKRVYVEGEVDVFLGRRNLRGALRSLNNGESYMEGIRWLGLDKNHLKIPEEQIADYPNLIGRSNGHCFFIGDGNYVDNYGRKISFEESQKKESFKIKTLVALI